MTKLLVIVIIDHSDSHQEPSLAPVTRYIVILNDPAKHKPRNIDLID